MINDDRLAKMKGIFIALLLFLFLAAMSGSAAADDCKNMKIGIVGASNTVDSPGKWSAVLKSKCPGSQFFIEAKSTYTPSKQAEELLPAVLAKNPDLVIISPSGNGIGSSSTYIAAVKDMANKAKAAKAKVAVLSVTPRKYYCYCESPKCILPASKENWEKSAACGAKWTQSLQQKVDSFNTNLLNSKLGSSDIDYVVDIYSPMGSSADKDVCGYCSADGGHLTSKGGEVIADAVVNAVFKGVQPSAGTASKGCGKKVAAVGDSLTARTSYVGELRSMCGSGTIIQNEDEDASTSQTKKPYSDKFSFVGKNTGQMRSDFDTVLSWSPDTVIILGGTNDIASTRSWTAIRDNLLDMYKRAKERNIRVVAVTIPPLWKECATGRYCRTPSVQENIKKLNNWIMTESPADIKVNIYDSLVVSGTDNPDAKLFDGSLVHPTKASGGMKIMAKKVYDGLMTGKAPALGTTAPTTTVVTGVPATVLPKTLYDFVINSSAGLTTIIGIARQNIAIGINKTAVSVVPTALCQQIKADKKYDLDWLKKTYGQNQLEVESQLMSLKFMGKDVRVHRLISPIVGCVENEIKTCEKGKNYDYADIISYKWQSTPDGLLATSSFGISFNININSNPNSQDGTLTTDLPNCTVDAFKKYGFTWGGDNSKSKSPSHFAFMADPSKIVVQQRINCPAGTTLVTVPATSSEAVTSSPSTKTSTTGTSAPVKVSSSSSPDSLAGNSDFVWPIPETAKYWDNVISCYGKRRLGGREDFHDGIDVLALTGTPLLAITDGTVHSSCEVPAQCKECNPLQYRRFKKGDCYVKGKYSKRKCGTCTSQDSVCDTNRGRCYGYGSNVIIKHADTLYTHYVHMSSVAEGIKRGAAVKKGQQIGAVGNTGYSQGSHLHFAIYNKMPKTKSGIAAYPEAGVNAFCYFPESLLTRLDLDKGSCSTLYGGSGKILSTSNPRMVKECKLADLSALKDIKPTPATNLPKSTSTDQNSLVQVCRPDTATSKDPSVVPGKGMTSAKGMKCTYCYSGRDLLKTIDPASYASCKSSCCKGACPSDAVVNSKVPFLYQCSKSDMGDGSDCWHDGVAPDRPEGAEWGQSYCKAGCGVAAMRMALKSYNVDKASKDLFCQSPYMVYAPSNTLKGGGSSTPKIASVSRKLGMENSKYTRKFSWDDITGKVKQGIPVVLFVSDNKIEKSDIERPYKTKGHYITVYGASNDYMIVNDPGRSNGKSVVMSKVYAEKAGGRYIEIA